MLAAPGDLGSYLGFRRTVSWGEPFFRERGPMAEALFGKGTAVGALARLDAAFEAGDKEALAKEGAIINDALQKLQTSFEKERARQARLPFLLPRAVYALGEILAGSKPGVAARPAAAIADAVGHMDAIEQLVSFNQMFASVSKDHDAVANRVQESLAALRKALSAADAAGELSERARWIVRTGRLGADIRSALGPSSDLWSPYPPAVSARDLLLAPAGSAAPGASPSTSAPARPATSLLPRPGTPASASAPSPAAPRPRMGGIDEPTSALTLPRRDALTDLAEDERALFARADAPIDRFARGDEKALTDEDRRGFDVLAGKARCTRCHAPPLFGVRRPPEFSTALFAVIGVPASPAGKALDADPGRGATTHDAADNGSFQIPTLRNVDRTAPYFHNSVFSTLESVVDFFDHGGGRGLGLDVPTQHPDVRKLDLTAADRKALLRFLRVALTDPTKPTR